MTDQKRTNEPAFYTGVLEDHEPAQTNIEPSVRVKIKGNLTDQKHTKGIVEVCRFGIDSKEFGLHFPNHENAIKSGWPHPFHMEHGITLCRGMDGPCAEANANRIMECWNACAGIEDPTTLRAQLKTVTKQRDELEKGIKSIEYQVKNAHGMTDLESICGDIIKRTLARTKGDV